MSESAAFRILDAAWSIGVRAFDTAEAYGVSAERLKAWSGARKNADTVEIVTKCSVDGALTRDVLKERACEALSRFKGIARVTLLTHGAVGADVWNVFVDESAKHHAVAGQSVYSPDEVITACQLPGMARVQAPGSVLDRRALDARKNAEVPLDLRSVYLQGLLLDEPEKADMRAPGAGRIARAVQSAAGEVGMAIAPLLIASMLSVIAPGDRLVIGVDDVHELDALPSAFEISSDAVERFQGAIAYLANDSSLDRLRDPRAWPAERTA